MMIKHSSLHDPMPGRLARRRRRLGLSVEAVAVACEMTVEQLRAVERGDWVPAPHQAPALARILELPLGTISRWVVSAILVRPAILCAQAGAAGC